MAKFANSKTYHKGNDNLNESQFTPHELGSSKKMFSGLTANKTETRTTTRQSKGEKGGKWKKKGRKSV